MGGLTIENDLKSNLEALKRESRKMEEMMFDIGKQLYSKDGFCYILFILDQDAIDYDYVKYIKKCNNVDISLDEFHRMILAESDPYNTFQVHSAYWVSENYGESTKV